MSTFDRVVSILAGAFLLGSGATRASAQTAIVTIDPTQVAQTIDGFGVAQPRSGPGLAGDDTPGDPAQLVYLHPQRAALMDMTFSALNGIGATILRTKITAAMEMSPGQRTTVDTAQAWMMREAAARGPVKLLGTVWSPPPWMKSNGSVFVGRCSNNKMKSCDRDCDPCQEDGDSGCNPGHRCLPGDPYANTCLIGKLNFHHYKDFADYLKYYVRDYAAENDVDIYAVSMANEPDTQVTWDGCAWLGDWIAIFLDQYLRPAFADDPSITTKVMVPEAAVWNSVAAERPFDPFYTGQCAHEECPLSGDPPGCHPRAPTSLLGPTIDNPNALFRVDLVAGHQYNGELTSPLPSALTLANRVWMTEFSGYGTLYMDASLGFAEKIHSSLWGPAQASAWLYFIYFGRNDDPSHDPGDGSLVATDGASLIANRFYWVFGNYSKYVRPGYVRLGSSSSDAKILATAFKDPRIGQRVVVLINKDTIARTVQITGLGAATATPYLTTDRINLSPRLDVSLANPLTLPAQSIVTFVASPPRLTSDILWRNTGTGNTMIWLSSIAATASYPGALGADWQIKGVGDFDGNGRGDILWRNANGDNALWQNGTSAATRWLATRDNNWRFQGLGTFDLNTRSDIVWRCLPQAPATTCGGVAAGTVEIWFDGDATMTRQMAAPDLGFTIQGIADFNGNVFSDILWRHTFGTLAIWPEGNPNPTWPGGLDHNWRLEGLGEFDGNFKADILWRCLPIAPATACGQAPAGSVAIWHDGTNATTWHGLAFSLLEMKGIGDFDGDGRGDILWRGPGTPVIWLSASGANTLVPENPGAGWEVAGVGGFDL